MAHPHHTPQGPEGSGRGHETRDADSLQLLKIAGGLVVLVVVFMLLVWGVYALYGLFPYTPAQSVQSALAEEHAVPPEPRLQPLPQEDLKKMHAREDSLLTSYGWVDRQGGIARVPIDSAMKMIVQQQLPFRRDSTGSGGAERSDRTGRMPQ